MRKLIARLFLLALLIGMVTLLVTIHVKGVPILWAGGHPSLLVLLSALVGLTLLFISGLGACIGIALLIYAAWGAAFPDKPTQNGA